MLPQRNRPSETRDAYRQKYDAEIRQWEARLMYLKAESDKCSAEAKLALRPHFEAVDTAMDSAKAKWDRFAATAEDKWEGLQSEMESAWLDVKSKLQGAYDALKKHSPN